jgi:hypothetical protein
LYKDDKVLAGLASQSSVVDISEESVADMEAALAAFAFAGTQAD